MGKSFERKKGVTIIYRELNDLDVFVQDFLTILQKHTNYLVVSGYISISTGRVRGTEDVDVLVPPMSTQTFNALFAELEKSDFWCYQATTAEEAHSYHEAMDSIRFAKKKEIFPNMELIPITPEKKAQWFELNHPQTIKIQDFEFQAAPFEFEILYKELQLKSEKDLEDARHLRTIFSDILNKDFFKECERVIKQ